MLTGHCLSKSVRLARSCTRAQCTFVGVRNSAFLAQGQVQMSNCPCAGINANERKPLSELICMGSLTPIVL